MRRCIPFSLSIGLSLLILVGAAQAAIITVDKNAGNNANFTSLQAAHNAAASGDTLYVAGSSQGYSRLTLDRTLFVFGPGYFLAENPDMQARPLAALVGGFTFNPGSQGSLITGLFLTDDVSVQTSNITIKRNRFDFGDIFIRIGSNHTNILVLQNYMSDNRNIDGIDFGTNNQNIIIANNYIQRNTVGNIIDMPATATAIIKNNVLFGEIIAHNSTFQDNIIRDGSFTGTNNAVNNNIANGTQLDGLGSNNQASVDMNNVFNGTGSPDGRWELKGGSPALGVGAAGGDLGMYGGGDPYALSGIPSIPAIYFFDAPIQGSTTSGLPVQMKVKAHN